MELSRIIRKYEVELLTDRSKPPLSQQQIKALYEIGECRREDSEEITAYCPCCGLTQVLFHSCGHRNCPKCQNHDTTKWIERQKSKLLPVPYFMVTFTLPKQLRGLFMTRQKQMYKLLFDVSSQTLREIVANPKYLGGDVGATGVLHTHNRRLDFHPHIHFIVPAGALLNKKRLWKSSSSKYLAPEAKFGQLFRGKLLNQLKQLNLYFDKQLYHIDWVVNSTHVGRGDKALEYLARYLYKGVIAERQILSDKNGEVTFAYIDSDSGEKRTRTLPGASFLRLILQHVFFFQAFRIQSKGFRRSRDYGFLHGNAKKRLQLLQLILQVKLPFEKEAPRPRFECPKCKEPMLFNLAGTEIQISDRDIRGSPKSKVA